MLAVLACSSIGSAFVAFDVPKRLNSNGAVDMMADSDSAPEIATDSGANWVTVWRSTDSLGGVIGDDIDILVARSGDSGETWSNASPLVTAMIADGASDREPRVATDGAGTWLAAWGVSDTIRTARSTDNGATWTLNVSVVVGGSPGELVPLSGGVWLLVFHSDDDLGGAVGIDEDVLAVRSVDDGLTWSPPVAIDDDASSDSVDDVHVRAAVGPGGGVLAVWSFDGITVDTAHTADQGLTWSPTVRVAPSVLSGGSQPQVSVASATGAEWVVAWASDFLSGGSDDVLVASSSDGFSWTPATAVTDPSSSSTGNTYPSLVGDSDGRYVLGWEAIGKPLGGALGLVLTPLVVRSLDGGITWSHPAALLPSARKNDAHDVRLSLAVGQDRILAVYGTLDSFELPSVGDTDIGVAISTYDCPAVASVGCIAPTAPRGGRVKFKNGDHAKDVLSFGISNGGLTTVGDVGTPDATSKYVLCQYDGQSGGQALVLEKDIPAGATCKNKPCWKQKGSGDYQYKDPKQEHGAIKSFKIRADVAGKTKLKVKAKGPTLGPPIMPLEATPDVVFQVHNLETAACWEAAFSTPDENSSEQYKARSD